MAAVGLDQLLARFEGVADRLERVAGGAAPAAAGGQAAGGGGDSAIALSFDAAIKPKVDAIGAAAKDADVKEITEATTVITKIFGMLRGAVAATGNCKKPKDADWGAIFKPVIEVSGAASKACDNRNDYFQNQKAAAELGNLVACITQAAPKGHVTSVLETVDFHLVKVMQKKDPKQTTWAKAIKETLKGLEEWCATEVKMGFTWKHDGQDAAEYFAKNPLGAASAGGAAAPKAEAPAAPKAAAATGAGGGLSAIFGEIAGKDATGLKKVTADQKTKNRPAEERSAVVPAKAAAKAPATGGFAGERRKGPKGAPIFELQKDTNWVVENQEGVNNLVVDEANMQQIVLVINCKNVTIQVKTKVKSICIDGCERVNVICADVLSVVELVNSDRCAVQTTGRVNSFAIDKCNGAQLHLPKESLDAEIVTSKSSEMNVNIPNPDEEGDYIEIPIPEQFVTTIKGPKLKTEVSSLYS